MLFLIGTFGLNFPIFISTMSVTRLSRGRGPVRAPDVDHGDRLGRRRAPRRQAGEAAHRLLDRGRRALRARAALAALMPSYGLFGLALVVIGVAAQTFTTTANSAVQLSTEPAMRGRVMAILLAIALGGTPIRRAHRRLGRRHVRPALGARRRRGGGLCRGDRRDPLPHEVPSPARAHRCPTTPSELRRARRGSPRARTAQKRRKRPPCTLPLTVPSTSPATSSWAPGARRVKCWPSKRMTAMPRYTTTLRRRSSASKAARLKDPRT